MGTHQEQLEEKKTQPLRPFPKNEKHWTPWVHIGSPHWLQEFDFAYQCSLPFLA
jgi:hypothetical protein